MAVIHVTEAEAARDLHALLERAGAGDRIEIDSTSGTFLLSDTKSQAPDIWTVDEAIRRAETRSCTALLDDQIGSDMEAIYKQHEREYLGDTWTE